MLPDGEDVESQLLGQARLLEEVVHPLLRGDPGGQVGEGGEAKLHALRLAKKLDCATIEG